MPGKWTTEDKFRLLLAIITIEKSSGHDWKAVEKLMGDDYSWNACRQQFQKIQQEAATSLNISGAVNGKNDGATPPATPKTPKTPALPIMPRSKTTPNKRKATADADKQEDENDTSETPTKKVKQEDG